jgi:hypothetical protein
VLCIAGSSNSDLVVEGHEIKIRVWEQCEMYTFSVAIFKVFIAA